MNRCSSTVPALPKWLKLANRLIVAFNRLGMSFGTWYILSIPGRKTGKMHSTPVSVLHVNGQRYVVTGFETQWVKNARKVGRGMLARGHKQEQVVLVELPVEERPPILRDAMYRQGAMQASPLHSTPPPPLRG
ncbi:MAG TPA: hypothetical protein VKB35_11235 [Ktedonobacteraceae bacterium]|nr:hypothetical protein [Ktedonobacteraceae bacterium]